MSAILAFLKIAGDRPVFCCQWFADNGNRIGMNGKIIAFDERHIVMQGKNSVHLFRTEDIIEIECESSTEIVSP
jgi:hypothetical protein